MVHNVTHNKYLELRPNQIEAIPHIVMSNSTAEAARLADVSRNTLHRWMRDPEFREALEDVRREAAELARNQMGGLLVKAIATLSDVMDSPNDRARTDAARTAVYAILKAEEYKNIEQSLERLDRAVAFEGERKSLPFE